MKDNLAIYIKSHKIPTLSDQEILLLGFISKEVIRDAVRDVCKGKLISVLLQLHRVETN